MSQQGPQDPNYSNQPPQYPGQPQYQQPYPGQQPFVPPPVKKKHGGRNFLIVVGIIVGLIVIASLAGAGGAGDSTSSGGSTSSAPQTRNDPRAVTPGVAFTIGKHRLDAGWQITYDQYLGSKLLGHVTNVSTKTSTAFFSVKFLKGNEVLANFTCTTEELEPQQVQQVECFNSVTTTERITGYDKVTAEATL